MRLGKKAVREEGGEELKVAHLDGERFGTPNPGFFVIKSAAEWSDLWEHTAAKPAMPQIDFDGKMLLIAVTDSAQAQAIRLQQVLVTGTSVHAYVRELRPGEGCPATTGGVTKLDFAYVDRIEKPVHFHVEPEIAAGCGGGPEVLAQCKLQAGPAAAASGLSAALDASIGQSVECEGKLAVRGTFAAIDERWYFGELPPGSASKLTFAANGKKVSFPVDTFGKFLVRFEVIDDAGRKGVGQAAINVLPPKDGLYVRLVWTDFGPNDDPETFPRTALELKDATSTCSTDTTSKPAWCDLKIQGHATQIKLPTSALGSYRVKVRYLDDRFAGGPVACVKVVLNGKETASVCDKEARKANDQWEPGQLGSRAGVLDNGVPTAPASATPAATTPRPQPPRPQTAPQVPKTPPKPKPPAFTP
jgi:hypothetical protein